MTKLNSEEWRNVHWVISPAVVCWFCQLFPKSLKPPCRVFHACSPHSQNHDHTRDAVGKEGWRRQVRDATLLLQWACSSPCCCHSSSLNTGAHLLSSTPSWPARLTSHLQHLTVGKAPSFTSGWALVSFACASCSHQLSVDRGAAWQLGGAQVHH